MILMILGLTLWWATHLYPIYLPGRRAAARKRLGEKLYKGAFSMFSVAALAFMVMGYRKAGFIDVWTPPGWTTHLNNLLMLLALTRALSDPIFCSSQSRTKPYSALVAHV